MKNFNTYISEKLKITKNTLSKQHNNNGHEFVDLDLPSGTLWAKCNIGAEKETNYGVCFAWGETKSKKEFNWDTYFDLTIDDTFEKYNNDGGLTELELKDDAARVNMGGDWCIPTKGQFKELLDNTTNEWVTNYNNTGKNGRLLTSNRNNNTIFFPATGYDFVQSNNKSGRYWTKNLVLNNAESIYGVNLFFDKTYLRLANYSRYNGFYIRGVLNT
jgi:hypothetical protein